MISAILSTAWAIFKFCFWLFAILSLCGGTFFLLHPLRFDFRLRASLYGQRAEGWFSYFFGLVGLGTIASPHEQAVFLRVGNLKWRLHKSGGREKPPGKKPPEEPPPAPPPEVSPAEQPSGPSVRVEEPPVSRPSAPDAQPASGFPATPPPGSTPRATTGTTGAPEKAEAATSPGLPEDISFSEAVPGTVPGTAPETGFPTPGAMTPEKEKAIEFFEKAEHTPGEKEDESLKHQPEEGFAKKFHKLRKKILKKLKFARKVYRTILNLWERFSPMIKSLFWDLWQTFRLDGPGLRVRYGFEEPYLVGMTQGIAAQIAGMLFPWGITIDTLPVFTGNTILINGRIGVRILPYKVAKGFLRMALEKDLWMGLKELWDWYKTRKKSEEA